MLAKIDASDFVACVIDNLTIVIVALSVSHDLQVCSIYSGQINIIRTCTLSLLAQMNCMHTQRHQAFRPKILDQSAWANFEREFTSVWLNLSSRPFAWGWYAVVSRWSIPNALVNSVFTLLRNSLPWSVVNTAGSPNIKNSY